MSRKDSAPSKNSGNRASGKAGARSCADFSGVGGSGGDPVMGGGASKGTGSGGGKAYHAAPKSKENKSPPNARSYKGFGDVGGKVKNTF